MASDRPAADAALARMQIVMVELQERLRELIRTIDDRDDHSIKTAAAP